MALQLRCIANFKEKKIVSKSLSSVDYLDMNAFRCSAILAAIRAFQNSVQESINVVISRSAL